MRALRDAALVCVAAEVDSVLNSSKPSPTSVSSSSSTDRTVRVHVIIRSLVPADSVHRIVHRVCPAAHATSLLRYQKLILIAYRNFLPSRVLDCDVLRWRPCCASIPHVHGMSLMASPIVFAARPMRSCRATMLRLLHFPSTSTSVFNWTATIRPACA